MFLQELIQFLQLLEELQPSLCVFVFLEPFWFLPQSRDSPGVPPNVSCEICGL